MQDETGKMEGRGEEEQQDEEEDGNMSALYPVTLDVHGRIRLNFNPTSDAHKYSSQTGIIF